MSHIKILLTQGAQYGLHLMELNMSILHISELVINTKQTLLKEN